MGFFRKLFNWGNATVTVEVPLDNPLCSASEAADWPPSITLDTWIGCHARSKEMWINGGAVTVRQALDTLKAYKGERMELSIYSPRGVDPTVGERAFQFIRSALFEFNGGGRIVSATYRGNITAVIPPWFVRETAPLVLSTDYTLWWNYVVLPRWRTDD